MASHSVTRARIEQTIVAFAAIIGTSRGIATAVAQEPGKITVEVGGCDVLESPAERLACYEAAVDAAKKDQARAAATAQKPAADGAPPPTQPTAQRVEAAPGAPAAQNGVAAESAAAAAAVAGADGLDTGPQADAGRKTRRGERDPPVEISATVAALQETVPNAFLITLDNGQVWRQVRPSSLYPLRSGYKVRLYSTSWGHSYRLEADKVPGFIQVERVK